MATKTVYTRTKTKKASFDELETHLGYLGDTKHPDHAGLTLHPGRNYNCPGQSDDDLIAAIKTTESTYLKVRDRRKGKRTKDRWEELIHNLGVGCYVTAAEREEIEKKIIAEICPDSPARATWHEDPETGETDLHLIFSTLRPKGTLTLERTRTHLLTRLQRLDKFAADLLNNTKTKPKKRKTHIETAAEVGKRNSAEIAKKNGKPKPMPLYEQIAHLALIEGIEDVEGHHLPGLLERLGIMIKEIIGNTIRYFSTRTRTVGKTRVPCIGTIHVEDYLDKILEAQVDIHIAQDLKKSLEASTETKPTETKPTETKPTETKPTETKPTETKLEDATAPNAEKVAKLKAYLEASLGITQVTSAQYTKLTRAAQPLIGPTGKIRRKMLQSLTPEQRTILLPLAQAYAETIQ